MIDPEPTLRLPLVHHLVQHRVLDLGPRVSGEVPAADRDLQRLAGANLHCQLTQPGAHAAGQPDRDLAQCSAEMLGIQLMMKSCQPVQEEHVARVRLLFGAGSGPLGRVRFHGKRQELPLRSTP